MTSQELKNRLHGIISPMVTPFDQNGDLDEGAFRANLEHYVGIGLAGVMAAGTTGEAPLLTAAERLRLVEIARSMVRPGELVIAGTGLESTRETIALSREALACGADTVLVVTPWYYKSKMDDAALVAHYRAVADTLPAPMLIYSIPQFTGVRIPVETLVRLASHPNIAGIKESSGDLAYVQDILRQAPADFVVFSGSLKIILEVLDSGGAGGVLGQADLAPKACVALYEAVRAKQPERARALYKTLLPLATEVGVKHGVPGIKAAMDLLGRRGGMPRLPLLPVSAEVRREIAAVLAEFQSSQPAEHSPGSKHLMPGLAR